MSTAIEYKIERKIKPSRVMFFATVNGRRINNINYARKYDAKNLIKSFSAKYTEAEVLAKVAA